MKVQHKKFHGLDVYRIDHDNGDDDESDTFEYAVGTEDEVMLAAAEIVKEGVWAFNSGFILDFLLGDLKRGCLDESISKLQLSLCEESNEIFLLLIGNRVDEFVRYAISIEGRAHFLSPIDGEEVASGTVKGLPEGLLAYRVQ